MQYTTLKEIQHYCQSLLSYQRITTHEVGIGSVPLGGKNPIRIQSMTTTDTMDTNATVAQSIKMIEAGCEYVRITAPSKNEAENLAIIKKKLRAAGFETPLVADIHFTPNAAEIAARIVEKVRINPGNYIDKKKFETIEYTESEYLAEIERIHKRFSPLVKICKEYGTAMRIGVNHGSLSDRIMSQYGDTPLGMVESAMEFIRICESWGYDQIVISMKASNPIVMVQAYRLLVQTLLSHGRVYPLHLGVTEAGEGEDGRIKSALGIATLLADGIGDTVRVSLTEPPEEEIPVARYITLFSTQAHNNRTLNDYPFTLSITEFKRRKTRPIANIGGDNLPRVIAYYADLQEPLQIKDLSAIGHHYSPLVDKWTMDDMGADYLYTGNQAASFMLPNGLKEICNYEIWKNFATQEKINCIPYYDTYSNWLATNIKHTVLNFVNFNLDDLDNIKDEENVILVLNEAFSIHAWRNAILYLMDKNIQCPVIAKVAVQPENYGIFQTDIAEFQLTAACMLSELLADGLVDGLLLTSADGSFPKGVINRTAFGLLQAARLRMSKTEYISCPSCGRTLFDLPETTAKVRKETEHLKGVKIAIMGCIVNGPGEMADADYGYVGAGTDLISLYRGKEMVEKGVKTEFAVQKLIELIQQDGRWQDAPKIETTTF